MQRLGVSNCIIVNYDGRKFPLTMKGFDKVLLDAPCTGLGVISRDPSIKSNRTLLDVKKAAHLQRELIRAAVDVCKVGGTIVYSTCSIAAEENEGVIDYIIRKRYVKVVETGLPIDKEGLTKYEENRYDPRVRFCRRVYPHMHNMDGFFIAKLIKVKDGPREQEGIANEKALKEKKDKKKALAQSTQQKIDPSAVVPQEEEEPSTAAEEKVLIKVPGERNRIEKKKLGKRDRLRLKGKHKGNPHHGGKASKGGDLDEADVDQQREQPEESMLKKRKPETRQLEPVKTPRKPIKEAPEEPEHSSQQASEKKKALLKRIMELKKLQHKI